ncbi:MAG TPA: tetratricopeptide repeat protein [Actinomycetales bacterium]|nr:tetratricopeptide repeat protein [Actinomycetales bacterium]
MTLPEETEPDAVEQALRRGLLLADTGRFREVLDHVRPLLGSYPDDFALWCLAAHAHLSLGQLDAGSAAAARAHRAAPDEEWPLRLVSEARHLKGDHEGAAQAAREAVRLDPENWLGHVQLARAAVPLQHYADEAWQAATNAVELAPLEADAHAARGDVALERRDLTAAEQAFREALSIDPENVSALEGMGHLHLLRRELVSAAEGFSSLGRVDPQQVAVPLNMRVVVLVWLQRTHLGMWAAWYLLSRTTRITGESGFDRLGAGLSVIFLGVLAWWTYRTIGRLRAPLRRTLLVVLRGSVVTTVWFGSLAVAALAALVMAWAPLGVVRSGAMTVAGAALAIGCVVSWSPVVARKLRRRS